MKSKKLTITELRDLVNSTEKVEAFDIAVINDAFFWAVEPYEGTYRLIPLYEDRAEEEDASVDKVIKNGTLDVPFQRTHFYEAIQGLEARKGSGES